MSECFINISNPKFVEYKCRVLYAKDKVIGVAQDNNLVVKACESIPTQLDCEGCEMANTRLPTVFSSHCASTVKEGILFLFDGKSMMLVYNEGFQPEEVKLDIKTFGSVISPIGYSGGDAVLFATHNRGKVQVLLYDYVEGKRISQSMSLEMNKTTDFCVNEGLCYSVFDKSLICCFDISTCKMNWKKFETGIVEGGLVFGKDDIYYSASGMIKVLHEDGKMEPIRTSEKISGILSHVGDNMLVCSCVSERGNNVAVINLKTKLVEKLIRCNLPVTKFIPGKGLYNGREVDALVFCADNRVGLINLSSGRIEHSEKINGAFQIDSFGNHVVIQRAGRTSVVLLGEVT